MTLRIGNKVNFDKYGEGELKAIRTHSHNGVSNRYFVFDFNDKEVIIPEAILHNFSWYKQTFSHLKDSKGFGLIELLITVAISIIIMFSMTKMVVFQIKSVATVQAISDSTAFVDSIRGNLVSPTASTQMLAGNKLTGQVLIYDPIVKGKIFAAANTKQQVTDAWNVSSVTFDSATLVSTGLYQLTIGLDLKKDAKRTIGGPMRHRIVSTVYCKVTNGTIISCNGITTPVTQGSDDDDDGRCGTDNGNHNGRDN